MEEIALNLMRSFVEKLPDVPMGILDVGSLDVNGSYRELFVNPKWEYHGLDLVAGKNVDIVSKHPYKYPIKTGTYDVVISGQCGEHVEDLHRWSDELIRVTKPKGYLFISIPCIGVEHRYPNDCWRIFPNGMRWLFTKRTKKVKELYISTSMKLWFTPDGLHHMYGHTYGLFQKLK